MANEPKHYLEQYDNGSPTNFTNDEITEEQLPELMELVGNIIFLFNSVEALLDQLIANIINERSHQPGYAVVSELNSVFTKKILVFKALYGPMVEYIKNDDLSKKFEALYTRLFKIKDIRNDITHHPIFFEEMCAMSKEISINSSFSTYIYQFFIIKG